MMIRNRILSGVLLAVVWIGSLAAAPGAGSGKIEPLAGSWGGEHIGITFTAQGASIEYDCAQGTIDGPVVPDGQGRFEATGTHTAEHGGPVRQGEEPEARPARYKGKLNGKTLTLTVILTDSGENAGTFTLTLGATPRLVKCL